MFNQERQEMIKEWLDRWFLLGELISTDCYKRTMWSSDEDLSNQRASYALFVRKNKLEEHPTEQLVMAGHEWILRQWFGRPLQRQKIEMAIKWYSEGSNVKKFPVKAFQKVLDETRGNEILLPINVWGLPGGQTFLPGIPVAVFEGPGALVSYLESHMCRYFSSIIHATKSRILTEIVGNRWSEFGYRSDFSDISSITKLLSIYIGHGGGPVNTSCDLAEFMFPEMFKAGGTVGHEIMVSKQKPGTPLGKSELEIMELLAERHESICFPTDTVSNYIGMSNAMSVMKKYPNKNITDRIDSGNRLKIAILNFELLEKNGLFPRGQVIAGDLTSKSVREINNYFTNSDQLQKRDLLTYGLGGYFWINNHRDTLSMAYKRTSTQNRPNMKLSEPGKGNLPGQLSVGEKDGKLISYTIHNNNIPKDVNRLFVPLVINGEIVYDEDMKFDAQADRTKRTWGKNTSVEIDPYLQKLISDMEGKL